MLDGHIDRNQGIRVVVVGLEDKLAGDRILGHCASVCPRLERHIVLPGRLGIAFGILPVVTPSINLFPGDDVDEYAIQNVVVLLQLADLRLGFHRLEDVAIHQVARYRFALVINFVVVGMRPDDLHREGIRQLLVVVRAGGSGHKLRGHGVAVAEVQIVAHRAGVQGLVHLGCIVPLPVAGHDVALGVLHGHAGDHVTGGHVLLRLGIAAFAIALGLVGQLLTIAQICHAEVRAPGGGQRRLVDGKGQRPGGGILAAIAPLAGIGILQRQGDGVFARVGLGVVAGHGVVIRFANVQAMGLTIVGHGGRGVGHRDRPLAHADGHFPAGGYIVRGVSRGEDHRVLMLANLVQLSGGGLPFGDALHFDAGICFILGRQADFDIAQLAPEHSTVLNCADHLRLSTDDLDRRSGVPALLPLQDIQILVVGSLKFRDLINPDISVIARLSVVCRERAANTIEYDVIELLAGININHAEGAQFLAGEIRNLPIQVSS